MTELLRQLTSNRVVRGKPTTVAVLDSGISMQYPALRNVDIAQSRSFTEADPLCDPLGHGTECCGVLVDAATCRTAHRVAPNIRLCLGQVIDSSGRGRLEAFCTALEWVANLRVDVVAIPLGRISDHQTMRRSIESVIGSGAIVYAAVGNPFRGQTGPLYPAAYPEVVGVGSESYLETYQAWRCPPDIVVSCPNLPAGTSVGGRHALDDTSHATMFAAGFACRQLTTRQNAAPNDAEFERVFFHPESGENVSLISRRKGVRYEWHCRL